MLQFPIITAVETAALIEENDFTFFQKQDFTTGKLVGGFIFRWRFKGEYGLRTNTVEVVGNKPDSVQ